MRTGKIYVYIYIYILQPKRQLLFFAERFSLPLGSNLNIFWAEGVAPDSPGFHFGFQMWSLAFENNHLTVSPGRPLPGDTVEPRMVYR